MNNKKTLNIPRYLDTNGLIRSTFLNQLRWTNISNQIIIDMSQLTFVTPIGLASLCAYLTYLKHQNITFKVIKPKDINVRRYLQRMDLFQNVGIDNSETFNRWNGTGRFQELRIIRSENELSITIKNIKALLHQNMNDDLIDIMDFSLSEIIENIFHHSVSPIGGVVCAQAYPNRERMEVAIVDTGIGIPNSLRSNRHYASLTNEQCLLDAIKPKVTSKLKKHSGEGLFFASEIIRRNKGTLWMFSENVLLCIKSNEKITQKIPYWQGTIITFNLPLPFKAVTPMKELFDEHTDEDYGLLEEL